MGRSRWWLYFVAVLMFPGCRGTANLIGPRSGAGALDRLHLPVRKVALNAAQIYYQSFNGNRSDLAQIVIGSDQAPSTSK
jgi:hypothetical protein